jgi:hypothetical protein
MVDAKALTSLVPHTLSKSHFFEDEGYGMIIVKDISKRRLI